MTIVSTKTMRMAIEMKRWVEGIVCIRGWIGTSCSHGGGIGGDISTWPRWNKAFIHFELFDSGLELLHLVD